MIAVEPLSDLKLTEHREFMRLIGRAFNERRKGRWSSVVQFTRKAINVAHAREQDFLCQRLIEICESH